MPHVVPQVTNGLEDVSEGQWVSELRAADISIEHHTYHTEGDQPETP